MTKEFGSNIQQILNYLILEINSRFYLNNNKHSRNKVNNNAYQIRPLTQRGKDKIQEYIESQNKCNMKSNNDNNNYDKSIKNFQVKKEQQLDHDLFRLLGKLLYNKRYVRNKNAIEKLKKEEFINNYETPRYYNINELINDIPISNNSFNDLLIYNSIEHFNDIEEYSNTFELYSFTDTLDNFDAFLYDKYNQFFDNNSYMKTYLNCLGVTTFNMSQYNRGKNYKFNSSLSDKGFMTIKKLDIKINKYANKFSDISFYKSCEYYPSLISLNIQCFYKEGFNDFYKLNFGNNALDKKNKRKICDNENNNNIHIYLKQKEKKKFLEENVEENRINNDKINDKENSNDSPKSIQMRNIPEEDRKAMENMFNENDESDEEDVIEE